MDLSATIQSKKVKKIMRRKVLPLSQSEKIMREVHKQYHRNLSNLTDEKKLWYQDKLTKLQELIIAKDKKESSSLALELGKKAKKELPKSIPYRWLDFFVAIIFALIVALFIRQMWFELYSIPSGSMRPTLKEQDKLLVSKTDYSINTPWSTEHFVFEPNLVKRGGIVIFSAEGIDLPDTDTMYFYIIPGKKQMVKRLIGKPGDILYFHGGRIYGIDSNQKPIEEYNKYPWFTDLEHIPFIRFEGKTVPTGAPNNNLYPVSYIYQMNQPVAKLQFNPLGKTYGQMVSPYKHFAHYFDLWGIKNYSMARILDKSQTPKSAITDADYFLELTHHPKLDGGGAKAFAQGYAPSLSQQTSYIPLDKKHLDKIFDNLNTCRFHVYNGYAYSYGAPFEQYRQRGFLPILKNIENGTYEFEDGIAYKVYDIPIVGGFRKKLSASHPLSNKDPKRVQLLFNLGIDMNTLFSPNSKYQSIYPSRYAYYRNDQLYLMGKPIFDKTDSALTSFIETETEKQKIGTAKSPYFPFIPSNPPLKKDGTLDIEFIKDNGFSIPQKSYLVLGDNHANSADSREFGFVPQENLRGGPTMLFWPPSKRWGPLPQTRYEFFSFSSITVWIIAGICFCISYIYIRKRRHKPLKF